MVGSTQKTADIKMKVTANITGLNMAETWLRERALFEARCKFEETMTRFLETDEREEPFPTW